MAKKIIKTEEDIAKELAKKMQLEEYRSTIAQSLHKQGLTDFLFTISPPRDGERGEECSILLHDNVSGANFEIVIVRGIKDIIGVMPSVIKKIAEQRRLDK